MNGQEARASWFSGAPGVGWIPVRFPANAGGSSLGIVATRVGQPFVIVDALAIGPPDPQPAVPAAPP